MKAKIFLAAFIAGIVMTFSLSAAATADSRLSHEEAKRIAALLVDRVCDGVGCYDSGISRCERKSPRAFVCEQWIVTSAGFSDMTCSWRNRIWLSRQGSLRLRRAGPFDCEVAEVEDLRELGAVVQLLDVHRAGR